MAKIKYNPEANPLQNEHYGFTFQKNHYGYSMFPGQKNDRKRYLLQFEKMQFMSKAIRNWRNMAPEVKAAWNDFATTYPVPQESDPTKFLTGYQLFLKRNFYRFLHEGISDEFILYPVMEALPVPDFTVEIKDGGWCADLTEQYIRNFGILPEVGQFIICRILPMSAVSGQFFEPLIATLEVQEIYLDGLICSFVFSEIPENIVFSIYVSKPVWESVQYPGTKFRYMGCFKPTKFLQLTDTPASYEGEAGKIVKVKEDETGLEFSKGSGCEICPPVPGPGDAGKVIQVNPAGDGFELAEGGGGSFDCDDLLGCSIIQKIINSISDVQDYIINNGELSIPPVANGLLYNWYAVNNAKGFTSSSEWRILTTNDRTVLVTFLGGYSLAGGAMKLNDLFWWESPNTGADNISLLNRKGGGERISNGSFVNFKQSFYSWSNYEYNSSNAYSAGFQYNSATWGNYNHYKYYGKNVLILRDAPGVANYTIGKYIGNNGRVYQTVVLNGLEIVADHIAETLYRDGSEIQEITDNTAWVNDTIGALCAFNNDWSNV